MTPKQMKRLILILIAIVIITIALVWGLQPHLSSAISSSTPAAQSPVTQTQYAVETTVTSPQSTAELLKASQQRRRQFRLDEQRLLNAQHQQVIMQRSDVQMVKQHFGILNDTQLKDGRAFVQYDPYIVESKFIGDHIKIDIPNTGRSYDGKVTDVEQVDDDIVRWRGDLDGVNGAMSNFTVTQALKDQYAIAVFHTPTGEYIMESKNGYGWVTSDSKDTLHDEMKEHAPH